MKLLRVLAGLAAGWGLAGLQHAKNEPCLLEGTWPGTFFWFPPGTRCDGGQFYGGTELEAVAWMALGAAIAAASTWLARPTLRGAEVAVAVLGLVGFGWAWGGELTFAMLLTVLFAAPIAYALHRWHGVALLPLILGPWFVISGLGHEPQGTLVAIATGSASAWLMSHAQRGFATPRRR